MEYSPTPQVETSGTGRTIRKTTIRPSTIRPSTKKERSIISDYVTQCDRMIGLIEEQFIKANEFRIREKIYDPTKRGYVIYKEVEDIAEIIIYSTTYLNIDRSRQGLADPDVYSKKHLEEPAIYVATLDVIEKHRGKGIALTLLYYGICKMYKVMSEDGKDAKFIKLTDATDHPNSVNNIYGKIGLVPIGLVEVLRDNPNVLQLIHADGDKAGRIETFFGSIPTYIKKYYNTTSNSYTASSNSSNSSKKSKKVGGKYLLSKKTYRRKRSGKNKRNIKSRKYH